VPTPWLDDAHTIFGEVAGAEDMDIVNSIVQGDTITGIQIDGDAATLLAEQSTHVEGWNATLDG
jgi:cyclophilin family peptidyl-prolyl cis-trans isomerase